jgi:serine phosphatase RsbU (regulator of sigma subunit)
VEAENEIGDNYGLERMIDFFRKADEKSPQMLNEILVNDIYAFKGKKSHVDDIAVLTGQFF